MVHRRQQRHHAHRRSADRRERRSDNAKSNYRLGYDLAGIVGHDFGSFRLEAEVGYRTAKLKEVSAGNAGLALSPVAGGTFTRFTDTRSATGDLNALSFMANALFDFGADDGMQASSAAVSASHAST